MSMETLLYPLPMEISLFLQTVQKICGHRWPSVIHSLTEALVDVSQDGWCRGNLSFATVASELVDDTTPQLGGDLDTNGNAILFGSSKWSIELDTDNDLLFKYNGSTVFKIASDEARQPMTLQPSGVIMAIGASTAVLATSVPSSVAQVRCLSPITTGGH